MHILLKSLLTESPDEIRISSPPYSYEWIEDTTFPFFAFSNFSLVGGKWKTHANVAEAMDHAWAAIVESKDDARLPDEVAEKLFNGGVTCSDIDAFIKDCRDGSLRRFMDKYNDKFYYKVIPLRKFEDTLCGRVWVGLELLSVWASLQQLKDRWDMIEKMFDDNRALRSSSLKDFKFDYLDRDKIFMERGKAPNLLGYDDFKSNTATLSNITPEEADELRKKLHVLPPEQKRAAMLKLGMVNVGKFKDAQANYAQGAIAEGFVKLKDLLLESVTENPNFKRWFGNSKVVDAHNKPLVVYHGTNQSFDKFDPIRRGASTSNTNSRKGFFFTSDKQESSDYADLAASKVIANIKDHEKKTAKLLKQIEQAERVRNFDLAEKLTIELEDHELNATREGEIGANVLPVYLSIQNPKVVNVAGFFNVGQVSDAIDQAKKYGNDGVILIDIEDSPKGNIRSTHYIVFKPNQIKSALANNGEFDPNSPYLTK